MKYRFGKTPIFLNWKERGFVGYFAINLNAFKFLQRELQQWHTPRNSNS